MVFKKVFIDLTLLFILISIFIFCLFSYKYETFSTKRETFINETLFKAPLTSNYDKFNIWCIFTKVEKNLVLQLKFSGLIKSIVEHTSTSLHFHVICDEVSKGVAAKILEEISNSTKKVLLIYSLYDVGESAKRIGDIVDNMTPHFSSRPGTYYSDALFYLSLGLHRIAPESQNEAIMLDCDMKFAKDVALLYQQFNSFKSTNLFGLAPELTPVYRHILFSYRAKKNTTFGDYIHKYPISKTGNHPSGFPGYNSGVMLFNLSAIRKSTRILANKGFARRKLMDTVRKIEPTAGISALFKFLVENLKYDLIVVSDSVELFVVDWLACYGLESYVHAIYASHGEYVDRGIISVEPANAPMTSCIVDGEEHRCRGAFLREFVEMRLQNDGVHYNQTVYVGDGRSDMCPLARLKEQDLACVREDHQLHKIIKDKNEMIIAKIFVWKNGQDVIEHFGFGNETKGLSS